MFSLHDFLTLFDLDEEAAEALWDLDQEFPAARVLPSWIATKPWEKIAVGAERQLANRHRNRRHARRYVVDVNPLQAHA